MIYPIVAYGHPVLRKVAENISPDFPRLGEIIEGLYETMYAAHGVGIAAPQVGLSIRLFVVDGTPMEREGREMEELKGWKKIFINPQIVEETGEEWAFEEGCLSIPDIREDVMRPNKVRLRYQDENFQTHEEEFDGLKARVIQHEYDHLEGVLFVDHISAFRKTRIRARLGRISKGDIDLDYPMTFAKKGTLVK
jgi:peptide deformylase